jgi:hypothetical protein
MIPGSGSSKTAFALLSVCLTAAPAVMAQTREEGRDPVSAEWLFRAGRSLMKAGDYPSACAKLEESLRLDPAVGTLMNLAECDEKLGRLATAWQRWGAVAEQVERRDQRRPLALARARSLEAIVPRLTVSVAPDSPVATDVERDGVALGPASLGVALPVDPGRHSIVVTAPGRHPREVEMILSAGELRAVVVTPGAPIVARVVLPREPPPRVMMAPEVIAPPSRRLAYGLLSGGAVALAAGGYFAVSAMSARRDAAAACVDVATERRCWRDAASAFSRDRRYSLATDVSLVSAAVLVGTGIYMLVKRRGQPRLAPVVSGGQVELASPF